MEIFSNPQTPVAELALKLPASLTMPVAVALVESLSTRKGANLRVDGSEIRRMGGQYLQILLAARRSWQADGFEFSVNPLSAEAADGLKHLGLSGYALSGASATHSKE